MKAKKNKPITEGRFWWFIKQVVSDRSRKEFEEILKRGYIADGSIPNGTERKRTTDTL